jgi:hypothetical protein
MCIRDRFEDGRVEEEGVLYVVSLPSDPTLLKEVEMECYAVSYIPFQTVLKVAQAYALGTDAQIKDLQSYRLQGYREDMDLYIFQEGVGFKEGLTKAYELILSLLKGRGEVVKVEPVVDVGTPPKEVMMECLRSALA